MGKLVIGYSYHSVNVISLDLAQSDHIKRRLPYNVKKSNWILSKTKKSSFPQQIQKFFTPIINNVFKEFLRLS
jgi:hypothetical protein